MARKKKYPFNNWGTPLDPKQLDDLATELGDLVCSRFGVDEDGDCPVEITITDRTRNVRQYWFDIPYEHKAATQEQLDEIEELLLRNLDTAMNSYSKFLGMKRYRIAKMKKEK